MKTARDRATAHLAAMANNTEFCFTDGDIDDLELLLKEQDKITREACEYDIRMLQADGLDSDDPIVMRNRCAKACMNAKAV